MTEPTKPIEDIEDFGHTGDTSVMSEAAAPSDPTQPPLPPQPPSTGFHPINVGQLVMGVAFLMFATLWLLVAVDVLDIEDDHWMFPLPWVVGGVAGLLAILVNARRGQRRP